jgi:hypothetical protein
MNTTELYDTFRSDVVDIERPYLWSDDEVYGYMDEAQIMFCRLAGGIADVTTTDVVRVPITAGEEYSPLHPSVLTIRQVRLASTGRDLALRNIFDGHTAGDDYGMVFVVQHEHRPGPVRGMVVGEQYDLCRWVSIPEVDDEAIISVYRLPLNPVKGEGQELEIRREHHRSLLFSMKHLAYSKQDAETFDRAKAAENEEKFEAYCRKAKEEWERYKHKPRSIKYGGIGGVGEYGPSSIRRNW